MITVATNFVNATTTNTASVASAGTGAAYAWTLSNGTILSGQGTTNITWTATINCTNKITVTVTTAAGCASTCSTNVTVNGPAGFCTWTPGGWGAPPNGNNVATFLTNLFPTVYGSGGFVIGGTYTIKCTTAMAIINWLPDGGTPAVLTMNYVNPLHTVSAEFGTQVAALKLNVDASTRGYTKPGLANLKVGSGKLAGYTVSQVLTIVNKVLGGTISALPAGVTVSDLTTIMSSINGNFDNCTPATASGGINNGYLVF
jgi:hypothetical protein